MFIYYLLLIGEESKRHYVLIKDFNTFMYDYTLHCARKHFLRKQRIKMPKKVNTLDSKIMKEI